MCMITEKNFFISCNEAVFHCANTDFGFREPSCFLFICCIAYRCFFLYQFEHFWAEEYFKYISGRAVLSYTVIFIYPRYSAESRFLNCLNLFFPSKLKICVCTFWNGPACSLPASVRFWLDNFLIFAAAAVADGWIYFAHVAV